MPLTYKDLTITKAADLEAHHQLQIDAIMRRDLIELHAIYGLSFLIDPYFSGNEKSILMNLWSGTGYNPLSIFSTVAGCTGCLVQLKGQDFSACSLERDIIEKIADNPLIPKLYQNIGFDRVQLEEFSHLQIKFAVEAGLIEP